MSRTAILTIVDAAEPPLHIFLGESPLGIATADYEKRLATWNQWKPISTKTQGTAS